jgi:hypothetical protein
VTARRFVVDLTMRETRAADQEQRLTVMKAEMAARVMSTAAADVYDVEPQTNSGDERRRGRDH